MSTVEDPDLTSAAPYDDHRDARRSAQGFERVPPQDLDAEQSVLGALLLSKDAIGEVIDIVAGPDFYRPAHATVFNAVLDLYGRGEPADPITVAAELKRRGDLSRIGGAGYLHTLVQAVPTAANGTYYADIVRDRARLRRLVEAGTAITALGYGDGDADEITDAAGAAFNAAVAIDESTASFRPADRSVSLMDRLEARSRGEVTKGVPTGFTDLDHLTNGLHGGQVIVIAARPAMGKSTLAVDFLRSATIKHGLTGALFSLEMGGDEVHERIVSADARVAYYHLRSGELTEDDWIRIGHSVQRLETADLHIFEDAGLTVLQIKAHCRRLQQRGGLGLVVVDYLQLMQSSGRKAENRQVEVAEMSRQFKLLAKELNVPVVVLSQLNRGPEQRQDKKPMISDLRESGAIEQDADIVILLHREDAYDKESPRAGEADLIVGKHRGGPTSTITVAAQLHYSRFVDMAATV
ncbi:replicative DNA helicase [Streptomyces sp. DSM 41987]|uniref:replicative DNA helicase n=2 Tax=Streptomyces TaxID=1883 RepID=UPI001E599A93|nr:replicative DNA helicase [Streptomyces fildesensis]